MNAKVITLATNKGGVGKSTLARNIAAQLSSNIGMRVAIIDADPQGSIIKRHNPNGLMSNVSVIAEPTEKVSNIIDELRYAFDYLIIDTGGFLVIELR